MCALLHILRSIDIKYEPNFPFMLLWISINIVKKKFSDTTRLPSGLGLLQSLILGESSSMVAESQSSATNALMCQVPPPHFCSMVVRLIALQILVVGVSFYLECIHKSK